MLSLVVQVANYPLLFGEYRKESIGIKKESDKKTCGNERRLEAIAKSTEHLKIIVKKALTLAVKADYILKKPLAVYFLFAAMRSKIWP